MANTAIKIDVEQILAIASQLESDNGELKRLLEESKSTIDGLASVYTGQAAEETRSSYDAFANKFFQNYYDVLDQYVKFLRNAAEDYSSAEITNTRLADAFK